MANYYETARTNYFRVKDETAFRAWVAKWENKLQLIESGDTFALLPGRYSEAGFDLYDEESDESVELADGLYPHLAPGSVAVIMGAGHEKSRYVNGYAVAVNSAGKHVSIHLDDIYAKAAEQLGVALDAVTRAEY